MTAEEVRGMWVAAQDRYNDYIERHKDQYLRYKEDFFRYAELENPHERKALMTELAMGERNRRFFLTVVELLSDANYWNERAAAYRVDDAIVLGLDNGGIAYWHQALLGADHKLHPDYEPVRGKVYLPGP